MLLSCGVKSFNLHKQVRAYVLLLLLCIYYANSIFLEDWLLGGVIFMSVILAHTLLYMMNSPQIITCSFVIHFIFEIAAKQKSCLSNIIGIVGLKNY